VILSLLYQGLILAIDQWLCVSELHGIVSNQKAEHHAVIVAKGKRKIGVRGQNN